MKAWLTEHFEIIIVIIGVWIIAIGLVVAINSKPKIEYKYESVYGKTFGPQEELDFRNQQGADGWEVVERNGNLFLLKRTNR